MAAAGGEEGHPERALGRPPKFKDTVAEWPGWSFTFRADIGILNPAAHMLLRSAEQQGAEGAAMVRSGMEDALKAARQVYFAL
eukprot:13069098-Alexandrium_andersonii.AAC.1